MPRGTMPARLPPASAAALVETGSMRAVMEAWSYMRQFIMPYNPSDTKYWCVSPPLTTLPSSSERMRREKTIVARVVVASAKYRPGSAMTRTPEETGKRLSRVALTMLATSVRVTSDSWVAATCLTEPEKPPPMSTTLSGGKPTRSAMSKASRALSSASRNALGLVAPDPTWKATPSTLTPRCFAAVSRGSISVGSAPYLLPRTHLASGSSARRRRSTFMSGESS
mmetsp:Transcript_2157/g.9806  ORF Transcript_2157/g.9806 Transcript_2157/m.9806 type:complete len:225 (+) Transcript_2157:642-1316(+)